MSNLIALTDITLRLPSKTILEHTDWRIDSGEHWIILGPNGAGKTTLLRSLLGKVPVVAGEKKIRKGLYIDYVGPELHRKYLSDDARKQIIWSPVKNTYPVETPETILAGRPVDDGLAELFLEGLGISRLLKRGIRTLSTGEMRKVLITAAAAGTPDVLILDEAFDGLDVDSVAWLKSGLQELHRRGVTMIMATHRRDEIIPPFTKVLMLDKGCVQGVVSAQHILDVRPANRGKPERRKHVADSAPPGEALIELKDVSVRYAGVPAVENISWQIRKGEHWSLTGPNGSGKTTLLDMMCGDNLQGYSNEIHLFGRRRGSGESIWDIKERIGYITPSLSARYEIAIPVLDVILSGYFDSIGLYRWVNKRQVEYAEKTARLLGVDLDVHRGFDTLSAGERMIVLIARALVKDPEVLILDEPCQGLDRDHRDLVLGKLDDIAEHTQTTILYVTHREDELPGCINRRFRLEGRKVLRPSLE